MVPTEIDRLDSSSQDGIGQHYGNGAFYRNSSTVLMPDQEILSFIISHSKLSHKTLLFRATLQLSTLSSENETDSKYLLRKNRTACEGLSSSVNILYQVSVIIDELGLSC